MNEKYLKTTIGEFYVNGEHYLLEVKHSTIYNTPEEAEKDKSSFAFHVLNGHVVLAEHSDWKQGLDENGKWFEGLQGDVLKIIRWEEWTKWRIAKDNPKAESIDEAYPMSIPWDVFFNVESLNEKTWCVPVLSLCCNVTGCPMIPFELFKSNVCHEVKQKGEIPFIINILEDNAIRNYFIQMKYEESLYLLAMLDYLSRKNNIPQCTDYDDLRQYRFKNPVFPESLLIRAHAVQDESILEEARKNAIPEFARFNIIENEVENVC